MGKDTNEELGELLLREDAVSPSELHKAKRESDQNGNPLGHQLREMGYIQESDLTNYLSKQHGVPSVNLEEVNIPEKGSQFRSRDFFPEAVAGILE